MRHTLLGMSELQTTGRRREVGAELRRIRKEREWPAYKLAERLRWTASHISRSEAGKRRVTDVDVGHYLGMCGAGADVLEDLLELINEPDDFRLQRHQGRIPDQLRSLIFHESTATQIHSYQPMYIPGVAQTADYARAVLQANTLFEPSEIEGRVQIRTGRVALVLGRSKPAQCIYYIHEAALRVPVGGPRVMHEQMLHLLFLGNRVECAIRVVPMSAGPRGMVDGSFQIFGYKEDPPLVYLQHETTSEFLESDEEVASYRRILQRVASVALDGAQSREFLAQVASDYERQEEARHDTRDAGRLAQEQL
jgi:transcriptional regulator with XRE-family HTH domain